jgi:hypothetical protein
MGTPILRKFVVAASAAVVFVSGAAANTDWYSSSQEVFTLTTAAQLDGLRYIVNEGNDDFSGKTIRLGADVDMSEYSAGAGWLPIGTAEKPFKGTFNGDGKVISGLVINNSAAELVGFFGVVDGGEVKKLGIADANITGKDVVGGVAGRIRSGAKLTECYVTGTITGGTTVGGVVGSSSGGAANDARTYVEKSYFSGKVNGNNFIGGILGLGGYSFTDRKSVV